MDIKLGDVANQSGFATLVGVSRQAIQKQCEKGNLSPGDTYAQWLVEYCDRLRSEAAGRGGDGASDLTAARIAESTEKTLALRYERLVKEGELLLAEQVIATMSDIFSTVRSQVGNAETKVLESLRSQYELDVDDEFVRKPFRLALESAARRARELGQNLDDGGGADSTETSDTDS